MKRIALLLLAVMLCFSLCSCDSLLKKAKATITGTEESKMPSDYITTLENEEYTYEIYESYVKIIKYIGTETEVVIPTEIDNKPITVIGSLCFHATDAKVTSVKISESIEEIEESAFYYMDTLTAITIPDNVVKISSRAFAWCNSLESVTLGNGITEIPEFCFNHCSKLASITLTDQITKIGVRAFSYCDSLTEVNIPSNISEVGERAFESCPALEYAIFESDEISIGDYAFDNCEKTVIIASDDSDAKEYCVENGLRWSTSKDIEAVVLGKDENASSPESTDEG